MSERYVGLVRVSTDKQGDSRLGLEAGIHDVRSYCESRGAELITIMEEVESGGHDELIDRPTLIRALTLCKRRGATLLVPKVDRLVRSTCVHTDIKRSGVPIRCVDMPEANEFTLDILVAVAAHERRMCSARTKAALAAYKREKRVSKRTIEKYDGNVPADVIAATAGKLGSDLVGTHFTNEGRDKGRTKGNSKQRQAAVDIYADLIPEMKAWRSEGVSFAAIATRLNERGDRTRTGAAWKDVQVIRTLARAAE